jgi:hypothetical protein
VAEPEPSTEDSPLDELVLRLLEVAARKDALRAWSYAVPLEAALADAPPIEARRDDDGTLGVFRFFEIVKEEPDAMRSLTPTLAKERIEPLQSERVKIGDEVGVELPLGRLAAIAWADVDAVRAGRRQLLPEVLGAQLIDDELAAMVQARLSALRGPPPHVPLRQVVTDYGGEAVLWTSVTSADPAELIVLVQRSDEHKLVVVAAKTSSAGHAALLRALAPAPRDKSLWRFFEVEGPALLCGSEGALWSAPPPVDPAEGALDRRLSLEVKTLTISRDPSVYGLARARVRLLTWVGDKIVEETEEPVGLLLDLPRALECPWPEGAVLERVRRVAAELRSAFEDRLSALLEDRGPTPIDALAGTAALRLLARTAADVDLRDFPVGSAEPCPARSGPDSDEELLVRFGDVLIGLSPGEDAVRARSPLGDAELFTVGALPDGDGEAWAALAHVLSATLAESDADIELVFDEHPGDDDEAGGTDARERSSPDDGSAAAQEKPLSHWLADLGERYDDLRWPARRYNLTSATVSAALVDRFVDPGPLAATLETEAGDDGRVDTEEGEA